MALSSPTRQSQVYQRLLDGSLREQRELALTLFGPRGAHLVGDWLDDEFAKLDDPTCVRLFTDRVVQTSRGVLLGGTASTDATSPGPSSRWSGTTSTTSTHSGTASSVNGRRSCYSPDIPSSASAFP
ncbi:hypothetical protein [Mycobacterium sp. AT1]|uniref:hypothetical protein n=1 Tax=Mycobacterium sp. AT1 TaxID=1961706 RepID=UPI0009AEFB01|nr:hypothetical protein [Mycobacterium sp. AT1]OPX07304.1 hypothetical protein B1790_24310 [Mycobacterium sp. AT1]